MPSAIRIYQAIEHDNDKPDNTGLPLYFDFINPLVVDPNRLHGLPSIRSTRVTVSAVLGQLAAGAGIDELLAAYLYLEREDVLARARIRSRRCPGARVWQLQLRQHLMSA